MKKSTLQISFLKSAGAGKYLAHITGDGLLGYGAGRLISKLHDRKKWYIPKFIKNKRADKLGKKLGHTMGTLSAFGLFSPTRRITKGISNLHDKIKHNRDLDNILSKSKIIH